MPVCLFREQLVKRDSVQSIRDPLLSVEEEEEAKSSSRYLCQHADCKAVFFPEECSGRQSRTNTADVLFF